MTAEKKHLSRERMTMSRMVGIYCAGRHDGSKDLLCDACSEFLRYAESRLEKCPYGEDKPTCANCPVHCYKPTQRETARKIMRYAGPRMLLRHPVMTVLHYVDGLRKVGHPRDLTREQRLGNRRPRDK